MEYTARLRKVAMNTSRVLMRKTLANMRMRIAAVHKAKGQHINID